jgi:hypothetical protein
MTFDEILQQVPQLTVEERKQLLAALLNSLNSTSVAKKTRSLLEFKGAGAYAREDIDAQEYVNQLRSEWDHRP